MNALRTPVTAGIVGFINLEVGLGSFQETEHYAPSRRDVGDGERGIGSGKGGSGACWRRTGEGLPARTAARSLAFSSPPSSAPDFDILVCWKLGSWNVLWSSARRKMVDYDGHFAFAYAFLF